MRRRNANKQTSTQIINIDEKEEHVDIDLSDFQKKLPNYSKIQTSRQSVLPNLSSLLHSSSISGSNPVDEINDANTNNSYSYSYSYSSSSDDGNNENIDDRDIPKESLETQEMNSVFQQLFDKFGTYDDQDSSQIEKKIQEAKEERAKIQQEIEKIDSTIGSNASNSIWAQKQFFTELINFIDTASSTGFKDFNEVKPEYLSIDYSIEKIKNFQRLDSELYKSSGFPEAVQEIFEFYAIIETNDFSFTENKPLIDLQWIRTGWKWTDEFGNPDLVPKVFETTCLPILLNKLRKEDIQTEENFHLAFLHCVEICDYCNHTSVAESQLFSVLKKRLESAFGTGKLKYEVYNKLMIDFGFKNVKSWENGPF